MGITPFFTDIGIEFSYLPKKGKYQSFCFDSDLRRYICNNPDYDKLTIRARAEHIPFNSCGEDEGAFEVRSPVFKNWKGLNRFYQWLDPMMKDEYKFVTHRDNACSGGGHIHIGMKKGLKSQFRFSFLLNLFRDLNNRPYLNWMFNEYDDDNSAENTYWLPEGDDDYFGIFYSMLSHERLFDMSDRYVFEIDKGNAILLHSRYDTIEYRIFDMVRCKRDLIAHVNFVNAYTKWIYRRTKKKEEIQPKILSAKDIDNFSVTDKCIREFYSLLREIGLRPSDYKQFVKMNYQKRKLYVGLLR